MFDSKAVLIFAPLSLKSIAMSQKLHSSIKVAIIPFQSWRTLKVLQMQGFCEYTDFHTKICRKYFCIEI